MKLADAVSLRREIKLQKQTVTVTRLADRHADLHGRDFAFSKSIIVIANDLADILRNAAAQLDEPIGRYSILISEPYD